MLMWGWKSFGPSHDEARWRTSIIRRTLPISILQMVMLTKMKKSSQALSVMISTNSSNGYCVPHPVRLSLCSFVSLLLSALAHLSTCDLPICTHPYPCRGCGLVLNLSTGVGVTGMINHTAASTFLPKSLSSQGLIKRID